MKTYHKNPRQITEKQFRNLSEWLAELGDLSGIVHDLNSDEIINGNQRSQVFDVNNCEIVATSEFDEPDEQGTVKLGYIIWQGKYYNYRAVRWTPEQCERANIIANKAGGIWDFDILADEFDLDHLLSWGFEKWELGAISDGAFDYDELWQGMPEFEQEDFREYKAITVRFLNEDDYRNFTELIGQNLTEATKSIWHPKQDFDQMGKGLIYSNES